MPIARTLLIVALIVWGGLAPGALADDTPAEAPRTFALLLNGGASPRVNYLSHLHHLQEMHAALIARGVPADRIVIFSSDGEGEGADLVQRVEDAPEGWWLLEGTELGRMFQPGLERVSTRWPEVTLKPATYGALRGWFRKSPLKAGDTLLIYVTDHGEGNAERPDNGRINLWHEDMSVAEFEALLAELPEGVQAVSVMSQCFSGSFAEAIYAPGQATPPGDTCGLYSTLKDRQAYGCYPGGRGADRVGHAFHFIDGLGRYGALSEAQAATLVADDRPDVPVASSTLYLDRLLQQAATAAAQPFEAYVDGLLQIAWRDRAPREAHIRRLDAIGEAYGTFSPRLLSELIAQTAGLEESAEAVRTYAQRWDEALDDLRHQILTRFLTAQPDWAARLKLEALKAEAPEAQAETLKKAAAALRRFAKAEPTTWARATAMREKADTAQAAWERLALREAIYARQRMQLIQVAGEVWLAQVGHEAEQAAFEALVACEAHVPGERPEAPTAARRPSPLPPFEEEVAVIKSVMPAWLGIQFRPLPADLANRWELKGGAVGVMTVFPGSPAERAGVRPGDVLLGPPGAPFTEPRQIREWAMLSPQATPLPMAALREREPLTLTFELGPYPVEWPELPGPPEVGEVAPEIKGLEVITGADEPELDVGPGEYLLFYWATWCGPCKRAVPSLLAWAEDTGVRVIAVTDEDKATVRGFLEKREAPFLPLIVSDPLRRSFLAYEVSGTPTFVWVKDGKVRFRQVGFGEQSGGLKFKSRR